MKNKAFTLIEVLIVVLIIGILAAIAVPQYQKAVIKSRLYALVPIVHSLRVAQENYYLNHGRYADSLEELDITPPEVPGVTFSVLKNSDDFIAIEGVYSNEYFGYRETFSRLTGAGAILLEGETGYCMDYGRYGRGQTCDRLGFPAVFENWLHDWHKMNG